MTTKTKLIKKGVKKLKEVQDDLFPDTLPKSPDAIKKATKEQQDKLKRDQIDMFPEDLAKRQKDAQMKKDMLGKKKRKKKAVKKAAGGPIQKFGVGGEIGKKILGRIWKKGKKGAAAAKKKSGELLEKSAEKTVDIPKNIRSKITTAKDIAAGKKVAQARHAKLATSGKMTPSQRKKVLKRQAQSGYASGGPVRKSIDGIAQRGLTRAKHK